MKNFFHFIMVAVATLMLHSCGANPQVTNNEESTVAHSQITEVNTVNSTDNLEIYIKIAKDILTNFYNDRDNISEWKYSFLRPEEYRLFPSEEQKGKLKISGPNKSYRYEIFEHNNNVTIFRGGGDRYYPQRIQIKKSEDSTYLTDVYHHDGGFGEEIRHKNIVYDSQGCRITLKKQIANNEAKLALLLKNAETIREEHKDIFAAILSSKNISDIEYIENNDNIEAFCNNDECSYRFLLKKSTHDNGYWGIINKMDRSAELQTDTSEGSSSIYALKISDKSTSTKRLMISLVRVVQNDMNNESDNQKKYGETSNTHHVVNEYKVASRGGIFSGDVTILPTNEDTFTKKYLSEISENVIYTYSDGALKINGRDAYQGKKHKL